MVPEGFDIRKRGKKWTNITQNLPQVPIQAECLKHCFSIFGNIFLSGSFFLPDFLMNCGFFPIKIKNKHFSKVFRTKIEHEQLSAVGDSWLKR